MKFTLDDLSALNYQEGSTRSLFMTLKRVLQTNGHTNAKELALEFVNSLPADFKKADVEKALKEAPQMQGDSSTSINANARGLLKKGLSVSEVAKQLGKSYQRIKNVAIAMKKSNLEL